MKLKCWECGKQIEFNISAEWSNDERFAGNAGIPKSKTPEYAYKRYYCAECDQKRREEHRINKAQYIKYKNEVLIERAMRILEKQTLDFPEYEEAIKTAIDFARQTNKFESAYELIAAIILINNEVKVKTQHKIGNYSADFYLEELKVILEVDGDRHKDRLLYDSNRDIKIRQLLGLDWEIVRIPTVYLDKNAEMLVEAIRELKAKKQAVRRENGGIIPETFSRRDKAKCLEAERLARHNII